MLQTKNSSHSKETFPSDCKNNTPCYMKLIDYQYHAITIATLYLNLDSYLYFHLNLYVHFWLYLNLSCMSTAESGSELHLCVEILPQDCPHKQKLPLHCPHKLSRYHTKVATKESKTPETTARSGSGS